MIIVVVYDLANPDWGFKDIIPQHQHATLESWVSFGADKILIGYLKDVKQELILYDLATGQQIKQIGQGLEGDCSIASGQLHNNEIFIGCRSFTNPFTLHRYAHVYGNSI